MHTLDSAKPGERCRIDRIGGAPDLVQRLMEFGMLEGEVIEIVGFAPLGDPIEIHVGGARLSLRKREAVNVFVTPL